MLTGFTAVTAAGSSPDSRNCGSARDKICVVNSKLDAGKQTESQVMLAA